MGYTTDLFGQFDLDRELTRELEKELLEFADTRHGGNTEHDPEYPGFWCQWIPTNDAKGIEWDGNEKFYNYVEWLQVIIDKFLIPNGYVLNGEVQWEGEESGDLGNIVVKDNIITVQQGKVVYE